MADTAPTRFDERTQPPRGRLRRPSGVVVLIAVQLFAALAYFSDVGLYFVGDPAPGWVETIAVVFFPVVWCGLMIVLMGPWCTVPLALAGTAGAVWARGHFSSRQFRWSIVAVAMTVTVTLFQLTSLGHAVAVWVLD